MERRCELTVAVTLEDRASLEVGSASAGVSLPGSGAVYSLDPPMVLVDLIVAVLVADAGLDQEPLRHVRVVLPYDFIG